MNCNCLQVYEGQNWPKSCIKIYCKTKNICKTNICESWPPMSNTAFLRYTRYFTIFHDISIWCNISRYFHDIFQKLNWSKICVISPKICPGSVYVEIFATKMPYFVFSRQKWPIEFFAQKSAQPKMQSMVLIHHK